MIQPSLPTDDEIKLLHKKYAPSDEAFESVYGHCEIVWDIARQLIERNHLKVDIDTVRAGCLLHDIGVYKLYKDDGFDSDHYIQHGLLGDELLQSEGWNPILSRIASHHTGVGVTKTEIESENLPLPHRDFFAETPEERLVMYADKFHSKSVPPHFNSVDWYAEHVAQFGKEKSTAFRAMVDEFGEPDLDALSTKYGFAIR